MAQFSRPSADTLNPGSYVNQAEGTSNLYQAIDEAVADDADYIRSPNSPVISVIVFKLSTVLDPGVSAGHVLRVRCKKDLTNPATIDVDAELRQSYVNEAGKGTLICTLSQSDISTSFTTYTHTLSEAEADAITDYSALYVRIVTNP